MNNRYPSVKALPAEERPRERMLALGAEVLTVAELLAIILGNGTKGKSVLVLAQEVLASFGSLHALAAASVDELCQMKGLGAAKAVQLKAALTLARRLHEESLPLKCLATTPAAAYAWVREKILHYPKEVFGVILLDARGHALRWEIISIGSLTQVSVHPREVFQPAIQYRAAGVLLVHNHPSGDPTPSPEDLHLTRLLVQAGRTVGIPIQDHLVIAAKGYVSLRERGFCFAA